MTALFPAIKPYRTYHWQVDELHTLYVEESGNPEGLPVLYLHGGPGGGCVAFNRQYFDPNVYRIILFDQRGCGRSKPHVELQNNTTQHLLADMEFIRTKLEIDQMVLFGGSWGSTLALVYAQTYPAKVLGLVLRGIFLARPKDADWFFQSGAGLFYPQQWRRFLNLVPDDQRDNIVDYYYRVLTGSDELKRMAAAKAWAGWEASCASLVVDESNIQGMLGSFNSLALACLESHYIVNNCFLEEDQILRNMHKIKNIPGIIVQGQYDMICPLEQAYLVHQQWRKSTLNVIASAGHAATERETLAALVQSSKNIAEQITLIN